MARSRGDGRGKQINGEIWGYGTPRVVDGKIVVACGGSEVGSRIRKRDAKELVNSLRRSEDKKIVRREIASE